MFVPSRPIQPNIMVGGKAKILPLSVAPERNPHIHKVMAVKRLMTFGPGVSNIKLFLNLSNVCNKLGSFDPSRPFQKNLIFLSKNMGLP